MVRKRYTHTVIAVLAVTIVIAAAIGCAGGGGGKTAMMESVPDSCGLPGVDATRSTGVLIQESEIATLPDWQRDKMGDTGWNLPYLEPEEAALLPAPTWETLQAYLESARSRDLKIRPRVAATRGASWMDQGSFDFQQNVFQGEYEGVGPGETPSYGCNSDGENGTEISAFEDIIRNGTRYQPHIVSFVLNGLSSPNWFNRTGGSGNDAQSAVYQLYASIREAEAFEWENLPAVSLEELTYRADLAPGIGPGGDCSGAEAYLVAGLLWKRFNSLATALPNGEAVYNYDILIAPSSEESALLTSSGKTDGRYQEFYCGDLAACYGGGWIVGVESSASGCAAFDSTVTDAYNAGSPWYYSPIYGVLLKRWQDTELTGMVGPWESWLGWPVAGPMPYDSGQIQYSHRGTYYAWGMWFERGFIWWLDYDQELYPEVPDEAQAFYFNGSNVMCGKSGSYLSLDTICYGGNAAWPAAAGESFVSVVADAYRYMPTDSWKVCQRTANNEIYVSIGNDGLDTVSIALSAYARGGTPNADGSYDYYVWAFRDGTIFMGDEATARKVTHTFGSDVLNKESVYTVRVQVTDSTGVVAYGDSLPIIIDAGSGDGSVGDYSCFIIRNDQGLYDKSFQAIIDDMSMINDCLILDYSDDLGDYYSYGADPGDLIIWYRGGPADETETWPDTRTWTDAEIDNLIFLLERGHNVLLVGQNLGYSSPAYTGDGWNNWYGWDGNSLAPAVQPGDERLLWALGMTEAAGLELEDGYGRLLSAPRNLATTGEVTGRFATDCYDNDGSNAAERNTCNGCGDIPLRLSFGNPLQMAGYGYCSLLQPDVHAPGFVPGVNCGEPCPGGFDMAFFSGGCEFAPYSDVGLWPGPYDFSNRGVRRLYWIGYPWATTEVTESATGEMVGSHNRYKLLHNILGWLDGDIQFFSDRGNQEIEVAGSYVGPPEIVSVTLGYWENGSYTIGTTSTTWDGTSGYYPDQTMPNVYVTTGPGGNRVVTESGNNDWINGNDIDCSFPSYAYIIDVNDDGVQTGYGNNVDDMVFFGGLLLDNPGPAWARDLTFNYYGQDPLDPDNTVPSAVLDGLRRPAKVAGYYVSTTGDAGGEVRAGYGSAPASFAFNNRNVLTAECIAHWPLNLNNGDCYTAGGYYIPPVEPRLYWSMYPGHDVFVPVTHGGDGRLRIEDLETGWENYRWMFDVDPSITVTGRATDPAWNRSVFSLTDNINGGRVVSFDYSALPYWNPDLNLDRDDNSLGINDTADKFPVRVRLLTEFADYVGWSGTWPDHLPDPGIDPAEGGPHWTGDKENDPPLYSRDWPDYIEGGAYVVDIGNAYYPMYVLPLLNNPPHETVAGDSGNYSVTFIYIIGYGNPDYTVEFNIGYEETTGDPLTSFGEHGLVYGEWVHMSNGANSITVTGINAPGDLPEYTDLYCAIRVRDSSDPIETHVYVWEDPIRFIPD